MTFPGFKCTGFIVYWTAPQLYGDASSAGGYDRLNVEKSFQRRLHLRDGEVLSPVRMCNHGNKFLAEAPRSVIIKPGFQLSTHRLVRRRIAARGLDAALMQAHDLIKIMLIISVYASWRIRTEFERICLTTDFRSVALGYASDRRIGNCLTANIKTAQAKTRCNDCAQASNNTFAGLGLSNSADLHLRSGILFCGDIQRLRKF